SKRLLPRERQTRAGSGHRPGPALPGRGRSAHVPGNRRRRGRRGVDSSPVRRARARRTSACRAVLRFGSRPRPPGRAVAMTLAVVAGALGNKPWNGGNAWTRLSWLLGLRRLGFDVRFAERI